MAPMPALKIKQVEFRAKRNTIARVRWNCLKFPVREITQDIMPNAYFKPQSMLALQESPEAFLIELFENEQLAVIQASRVAALARKIKLILRLNGWDQGVLRGCEVGK